MRLTAKDVNSLIEDVSQPGSVHRSTDDYLRSNAENRLRLVQELSEKQNQSSARHGETLPPPPRSLKSRITSSNDFGVDPNAQQSTVLQPTTTTGELEDTPEGPDDSEGTDTETNTSLPQLIEEYQPDSPATTGMPRAILGCDPQKLRSRAELCYFLAQNFPLNELNLPRVLYRTDLLNLQIFTDSAPSYASYQAMQEHLDVATIHLSYVEGFPALPDNTPLWSALPWELPEAFAAFLQYCEQPGARQTGQIAAAIKTPHEVIIEWYHENYWHIRAKCFDMMHAIHLNKLREQRILTAEDRHYKAGEKIFAKMQSLEAEVNWDILKDDPKQYIDVLEKVIKLQRQALGLGAPAPTSTTTQQLTRTESVEASMKKLSHADNTQLKTKNDELSVRSLLRQSPDTLASAQELIVRMTQTQTTTTTTQHQDPNNPSDYERDNGESP